MTKKLEKNTKLKKLNIKNNPNGKGSFNPTLIDEILKDYDYQNPEELIGSNGLLKQLKKAIIERALEGEMTHHLGYSKSDVATLFRTVI